MNRFKQFYIWCVLVHLTCQFHYTDVFSRRGNTPLFIKSLEWSKSIVVKVMIGPLRKSKSASPVCCDTDMRISTGKQMFCVF